MQIKQSFGMCLALLGLSISVHAASMTPNNVLSDAMEVVAEQSGKDAKVEAPSGKEAKTSKGASCVVASSHADSLLTDYLDVVMDLVCSGKYDQKAYAAKDIDEMCTFIETVKENPLDVSTATKTSVFHFIAAYGGVDDVKRVMKAAQRDIVPALIDTFDNTPLDTVIEFNPSIEMISFLIKTGLAEDCLYCADRSALHCLCALKTITKDSVKMYCEIIDLLLLPRGDAKAAAKAIEVVNRRNGDGLTPLHCLVRTALKRIADDEKDEEAAGVCIKLCGYLIDHYNAKINIVDHDGFTVVDYANVEKRSVQEERIFQFFNKMVPRRRFSEQEVRKFIRN